MQSPAINKLVLWELVTSGKVYLNELVMMQENMSRTLKSKIGQSVNDPSLPTEIMGFPLTPQLSSELKRMNLTRAAVPSGCKSLTIYNQWDQQKDFGTTNHNLPENESHSVQYITDHLLWKNELYRRLIPRTTLDAIISWFEGVAS
jgi:hypothetical protein